MTETPVAQPTAESVRLANAELGYRAAQMRRVRAIDAGDVAELAAALDHLEACYREERAARKAFVAAWEGRAPRPTGIQLGP